jgi:hypothetical protein
MERASSGTSKVLNPAYHGRITNIGDAHHILLYWGCLEEGCTSKLGDGTGGRHEYPA